MYEHVVMVNYDFCMYMYMYLLLFPLSRVIQDQWDFRDPRDIQDPQVHLAHL